MMNYLKMVMKFWKGPKLRELKKIFKKMTSMSPTSQKSRLSGYLHFKLLLKYAMLVTESEKAKFIRSKVLDIVLWCNSSKIRWTYKIY